MASAYLFVEVQANLPALSAEGIADLVEEGVGKMHIC
jgi:hypothetical protein